MGVAWDGTGWGPDGTIWGGEFFRVDSYSNAERVAHIRAYPLLGGDQAAREPRRVGLALLLEALGHPTWEHPWTKKNFSDEEISFWQNHNEKILTTSVGRLFDGVAALLEVCTLNTFEGEAAMKLEGHIGEAEAFPEQGLDWRPWIKRIAQSGNSKNLASQFIMSLVESIRYVSETQGLERIVVSGGVFQNRELVKRLPHCYIHKNVPPNDSGLSLGQLVAAKYKTRLSCV